MPVAVLPSLIITPGNSCPLKSLVDLCLPLAEARGSHARIGHVLDQECRNRPSSGARTSKTAWALTAPRGFESHALRHHALRPHVPTWLLNCAIRLDRDLGLSHHISQSLAVAQCSGAYRGKNRPPEAPPWATDPVCAVVLKAGPAGRRVLHGIQWMYDR